jgi:hypothetical protein
MRRWLPQLFWATVVGPPFSDLLGADRLRTAPAAAVEEVAPGTFLLILADRAADVVGHPERVDGARRRIQAHLGEDAFWDPGRGVRGPYRSVGAAPRPRREPAPSVDAADVVAQLVRDVSSAVAEMLAEETTPYPVGLLWREDGTTDTVVIGDEADPEIAAVRLEEALSAMWARARGRGRGRRGDATAASRRLRLHRHPGRPSRRSSGAPPAKVHAPGIGGRARSSVWYGLDATPPNAAREWTHAFTLPVPRPVCQ